MLSATFKNLSTILLFFLLIGCGQDDEPTNVNGGIIQLNSLRIGTYQLDLSDENSNTEAPANQPIVAAFTAPLANNTVENAVSLVSESGEEIPLSFTYLDDNRSFAATAGQTLLPNESYELSIANTLKGADGSKFPGYSIGFTIVPGELEIASLSIDEIEIADDARITEVSLLPDVELTFSATFNPETISNSSVRLLGPTGNIPILITLADDSVIYFTPNSQLDGLRRYTLQLTTDIKGTMQETFTTYTRRFYTQQDPEPDFPVISDEELLTLVQQQTFKYFYNFAHPASGMARERNSSGDIVTTGGTGFGLMALIVGIERGFISREQGIEHFEKVISFLETADRFHGVWPHWLNGNTGDVQPFSTRDNGGDLVETSFLIQGLLTVRQYLNADVLAEASLIEKINTLWREVEWGWHTKGGENVLYWHWSPQYEWQMNHPIRGYNEALITYFLAAASPTYPIDAEVYHQGWARNGAIVNGNTYYGIELPLGFPYGGPLFFAHYSFLGLNPNGLSDSYANYWEQNVAHSIINQQHAIVNPRNYVGYSEENWGFTASDNQQGYSAHSPENDLGVITPTAALSSFPYTPEASLKTLKFFYYQLGDRLWGEYGFYDAFNITEGWTANSYLAIDQGPIVVMIENYRSGLLWNLFMSAPEVQTAMDKLGFVRE